MKNRDDLIEAYTAIGLEGLLSDGTLDNLTLNLQPTGFDALYVNNAATGTVTCNLATATVFDITLTGNTTIAFSNIPVPVNQSFSWTVRVKQDATPRTLTFPTATWLAATGTYTTPAAGKITEYVFSTQNGTTILARQGASS